MIEGVAGATLGSEERAHFGRSYRAYRQGMDWAEFGNGLVWGSQNPLLQPTGRVVTREIYGHPLFQAVRDLGYRLGIRQGTIAPSQGDDIDRDPLAAQPVDVDRAVS